MSDCLAISASFSVFAMAAFALFATPAARIDAEAQRSFTDMSASSVGETVSVSRLLPVLR